MQAAHLTQFCRKFLPSFFGPCVSSTQTQLLHPQSQCSELSTLGQVGLVLRNSPTNAGGLGDVGLIPGWGRSPGGGRGNPFQHSCLENPMERGAWRATVRGVAESDTTAVSQHTCNTGRYFIRPPAAPRKQRWEAEQLDEIDGQPGVWAPAMRSGDV